MAERVASLSAYSARLYGLVGPESMRRISRQAGFAGKDAALSALDDKLGTDRAMSNFKSGKVRLTAGFDQGVKPTEVIIGHRPKGLWSLADKGRSASGSIYPKRGPSRRFKGNTIQPGRAVMTPQGPRSRSSFRPSRGTGVFRIAAARERDRIPAAAFRQLQKEIGATVKGGTSIARMF